MAEGKKSFVLYTDLIEITEELTNEEAGLLFKTILRYVNDLNPEIPKEIKLAFIPIRQDLKRDLKKYEAQVERITRINEERKRKKENQERNEVDTISHEVEGVNVNVNVNDNVNVNVNDISKDIVDIDSVEVKEFILELPTISSAKGNKYPIFQEDIDKWQSVYIGVDVLTELKKMKLWLEANPKSKKTYQGIPRFVNNWLSREQDKASRTLKNNPVGLIDDDEDYNGGFKMLGETDEEFEARKKRYEERHKSGGLWKL